MTVRPDDLANVCAVFHALGVRAMRTDELERCVASSLPLDSTAAPKDMLEEALEYGLLACSFGQYTPTRVGRMLGRKQGAVCSRITRDAAKCLVRSVYLPPEPTEPACSEFLRMFSPDVRSRTFVYGRRDDDSAEVVRWLQMLSRVGFLRVERDKARVESHYVSLMNEVLARLRGARSVSAAFEAENRKRIGDLAEELAMEHEKQRLTRDGHGDLASLVQRISLVDQSAGYDIASFLGGSGGASSTDVFIEVKGTQAPAVEFYWSRNEKSVATEKGGEYWIYCYTDVDLDARTGNGPFKIGDPARSVCPPAFSVEAMREFVRRV